jgi:hypothetical protein
MPAKSHKNQLVGFYHQLPKAQANFGPVATLSLLSLSSERDRRKAYACNIIIVGFCVFSVFLRGYRNPRRAI